MNKPSKCSYYWCIVPMCVNTSIKTPEKTFIQVPLNEKRRKLDEIQGSFRKQVTSD